MLEQQWVPEFQSPPACVKACDYWQESEVWPIIQLSLLNGIFNHNSSVSISLLCWGDVKPQIHSHIYQWSFSAFLGPCYQWQKYFSFTCGLKFSNLNKEKFSAPDKMDFEGYWTLKDIFIFFFWYLFYGPFKKFHSHQAQFKVRWTKPELHRQTTWLSASRKVMAISRVCRGRLLYTLLRPKF